jgi:hypothetical protein
MRSRYVAPVLMLLVLGGPLSAKISIQNLLTAMQRSKQKRTMADIRSMATAWESRATDENTYGTVVYPSYKGPRRSSVNESVFVWPTDHEVSYAQMKKMLVPRYIEKLEVHDSWGFKYEFAVLSPTSAGGPDGYALRSPGRDGKFEGVTYKPNNETTDPDADVVYSNGAYIQWYRFGR